MQHVTHKLYMTGNLLEMFAEFLDDKDISTEDICLASDAFETYNQGPGDGLDHAMCTALAGVAARTDRNQTKQQIDARRGLVYRAAWIANSGSDARVEATNKALGEQARKMDPTERPETPHPSETEQPTPVSDSQPVAG